jgi:hypothetical protein
VHTDLQPDGDPHTDAYAHDNPDTGTYEFPNGDSNPNRYAGRNIHSRHDPDEYSRKHPDIHSRNFTDEPGNGNAHYNSSAAGGEYTQWLFLQTGRYFHRDVCAQQAD